MCEAEGETYEIGLAMAGAISAGAYSAGVIDFLFQALEEWERHRSLPDVPNHRVCVKVVTGASAGAITGALGIVGLAGEVMPANHASRMDGTRYPEGFLGVVKPGRDERVRENPQDWLCTMPKLYKAWVTRPRMVVDPANINTEDFLGLSDLVPDEHGRASVRSLLNSEVLDKILQDALDMTGERLSPPRPYVASDLHVYLTVSNLRGVPYKVEMAGGDYPMMSHGDRVHFVVRGLGSCESHSPWAREDRGIPMQIDALFAPTGCDSWRAFGETALASSAFPIGLRPRELTTEIDQYIGRKIPLDYSGTLPSPEFPKSLASVEPKDFRFLNVDGGLINNEPFEYARFSLMQDPPKPNDRTASKVSRTVVMVDPFPEPPIFLAEGKPLPDVASVVAALLPALKNQARFKPSELLLAALPDTRSRRMIAPDRRPVTDEPGDEGNWPAAGFVDTEIRVSHEVGGCRWDGDSSAGSSSWRRSGWSGSAGFRWCRPAATWMWARTSCGAGSRSSRRILDRPFQVRARSNRSSRRSIGCGVRSPSSRQSATS